MFYLCGCYKLIILLGNSEQSEPRVHIFQLIIEILNVFTAPTIANGTKAATRAH